MKKLFIIAIAIAIILPQISYAALTDNIVSYWKFDESSGNASDSVNGNTLTNNGTITYGAAKINNGATLVSASSQYFGITDASQTGLDFAGSFSASMWIKFSALSGVERILGKYNSAGVNQVSYAIDYDVTGGNIRLILSSDGTNLGVYTEAWTPSTGVWYFITTTFNSSTKIARIYVNASQLGTDISTTQSSLFNSTAMFSIGAVQNGTAINLDATVDETGVWSRELTSSEVTQLYNGGSGLQYPFGAVSATTPITSLVNSFWW